MEKNKHILKAALEKLPAYEPTDSVWTGIRQELADTPLKQAIRDLPDYDPPEQLWMQIQDSLATEPAAPKVRRINWRAAAAITLLLGCAWLITQFLPGAGGPDVKLSYSVEEVDNSLLAMDWMADEDAFDQLSSMCEQHPFLCQRPDIQNLRRELNELTDAKFQLVDVLGPYGTDLGLIEQLNEIEMERTKLLKQILTEVVI